MEMVNLEVIQKSFQVYALSCNLDGSEDGELMYIKHGPCQSLLPRLQAVRLDKSEEMDLFEISVSEEIRLLKYGSQCVVG